MIGCAHIALLGIDFVIWTPMVFRYYLYDFAQAFVLYIHLCRSARRFISPSLIVFDSSRLIQRIFSVKDRFLEHWLQQIW
jgi:hypothetical protein